MPSKKRKYNARFPAGRIKKIMQTDEEVGKVAQAVPVIISRTLELFVESLLKKSMQITQARSAKTLTPSHMKQCILSENRFDFLKDLVKDVPDPSAQEDNENNEKEADYIHNKLVEQASNSLQSKNTSDVVANVYSEQSTSSGRTPVIQYGPKVSQIKQSKPNFSVETLANMDTELLESNFKLDLTHTADARCPPEPSEAEVSQLVPNAYRNQVPANTQYVQLQPFQDDKVNVPPLIPISHNMFGQNTGDNLYIDEDYDN